MKKYILLITVISFSFFNCKAQQIVNVNTYNTVPDEGKYFKDIDNNFANFTGTWSSTNGNLTFKIILVKAEQVPNPSPDNPNYYMDEIHGHFIMIQDEGTPNETIVYESHKNFTGLTNKWEARNIILASTNDGITLAGSITDNCVPETYYRPLVGHLKIVINAGTNPPTATFSVKRKGMTFQGQTFTIPTDLTLTKE